MTRSLTETRQLPRRFDESGVIDCDGHIFEPLAALLLDIQAET
jgi:hypothetical protein